MRDKKLVTVCEEAACPNIGECWSQRHATMMIMGEICTRACAFCNVRTGVPAPLDADEPQRVAEAVATLGLRHVVITSVDRDDVADGGAAHFAEVIAAIRAAAPGTTIEILTPDFMRKPGAIEIVAAARPDVFNHNLETVPRLYPTIRPGARYYQSLRLLDRVKQIDPSIFTKSGLMVGLGETTSRDRPGDGRSAHRRCRFSHHRPISAADAQARGGGPLRDAGRVRGLRRGGAREGVPAGFRVAADAQFLPRGRGFRVAAGGAGEATGRGAAGVTTHAEKRVVRYSPAQLFALVADVAKYPSFLPWCVAARIRSNVGNDVVADLTIGFGPFRESFTSRVKLIPRCDRGLRDQGGI